MLTYAYDCILISTSMQTIDELITSLEKGKKKFILTDEGDIDKFLGIEIQHFENGSFEISQPHLINRILQVLHLDKKNEWSTATKWRELPGTSILSKEPKGKPRKYEDRWNYRTAVSVGMLTHLQGNSRPDISVHVHQAKGSLSIRREFMRQLLSTLVDISLEVEREASYTTLTRPKDWSATWTRTSQVDGSKQMLTRPRT